MMFLTVFLFSEWAYSNVSKNIDINVYISKQGASEGIEIISEDKVYFATYNIERQRFFPLVVPFSVRSPLAAHDTYNLMLTESVHVCGDTPLAVQIDLDGKVIKKKELRRSLPFTHSNNTYKWREHQLRVSFPEIPQGLEDIQCNGLIGVSVELTV